MSTYNIGSTSSSANFNYVNGLTFNSGGMIASFAKQNNLDDKLQLIYNLAGFKKNEITVKILTDNSVNASPYLEVLASSKTNYLKVDYQNEYTFNDKYFFQNNRVLNYSEIKLEYVDGLLVVEIPYAENSVVKKLEIQ